MAMDKVSTGSSCSVTIPLKDVKLTQMTQAGG